MSEYTSLPQTPVNPPPKPWYKGTRGITFLAILGIIVASGVTFIAMTTYYVWQIKYGDAKKIAEYFAQNKLTSHGKDRLGTKQTDPNLLKSVIRPTDPSFGNPDAPITIVAFMDYDCQYSREFSSTFNKIMDRYAPAIRIIYKFFPLGLNDSTAEQAALAASCAHEQGKFWSYHDLLFSQAKFDDNTLISYADRTSLNQKTFSYCLNSKKYATNLEENILDADRLGVIGTPTIFINQIKVEGAKDAATWDKLILEALQVASPKNN